MNTSSPSTNSESEKCRRKRRRRLVAAFIVVAHLAGFSSSIDALISTRTAQGAVAWIVSLNTLPYVAVPAYWIFGRTKFEGYTIARQTEDSELAMALSKEITELHSYQLPDTYEYKDLRAVQALAKLPFVRGNDLELLVNGEAIFDSIFRGIKSARKYILAQSYIIRDDEIGREFQKLLIDRARAGIDVYLLYDEIGSYGLPQRYVDELVAAGVKVHSFHSTRGSGNRFQVNFRNHRKVIIVDGETGWIGGANIGDEYVNSAGSSGWRDTQVKITGPAALELQLSFVEDWHWATNSILDLPWQPMPSGQGNTPVLVLPSGPADRFDTASLMVQQAIHSATDRIWISSPYFVPDEGMQGMLKLAALGGVDVRILIPETPDSRLAYYAAYAFIGNLMEAGVKIYRYQNGFLHGKSFVVDDVGAAVGTVNLDNRSFRLNFESTAIVLDEAFAVEVENMFLRDFRRSRLMTRQGLNEKPLWFHVLSRGAYLFAPVL